MSNYAAAYNVMHFPYAYHTTRVCSVMALTERGVTSLLPRTTSTNTRACFGLYSCR